MGALFAGEGAKLVAGVIGSDGLLEFALDSEVVPLLCARFELEAHARGDTKGAEKARGLVGETVNGESANFAVLDVREAVGGIEKQAARGGIERDGNGV